MILSMTSGRSKVVIDSNILISAAIYPDSPSAEAYRTAVTFCDLFASAQTLAELEQVLFRPKFDRYFSRGGPTRERFLRDYKGLAKMVEITQISTDCADAKDNQFLSLALSAGASILVSGDQKHLIPMHLYRGIAIVSAAQFVQEIMTKALRDTQ